MTAENEAAEVGPALPRSRGRWATRSQKLTIITIAAAAGLGVLVLSNWLPSSNRSNDDKAVAHVSGPGVPLKQPAATPTTLPMPAATPAAAVQQYVAPVIQMPNPSKATSAPVLSYAAAGSGGSEGGRSARGGVADEEAQLRSAEKEEDGSLASSLRPARIGGASKAVRIKNPDKIINRGEPIPCSLQTAINSQLPGFVTCITATEVRSLSGRATLMDRGTKLFGEVKSGLKQGADRLFILWTSATIPMRTRHGIEYIDVALDSPAADELGRAGVSGEVDRHFWRRFGAALLFSVIEAVPQVAASALQNGNNNSYTNLNSSPTSQLAGTILNETIHIPDTLTKNQGETVMVMVARPLDFSSVVDFELVDQ
jgi:type IV secretion system protein VirB10